jgi:hypothetical protein
MSELVVQSRSPVRDVIGEFVVKIAEREMADGGERRASDR